MHFVCRYGTPDGRVLTEVQAGSDAESVRRELERRGCHIFEVKPKGFHFDLGSLLDRRSRKKLPLREFLAFNQELAALLRAGLPILQALDLMLERMEHPVLRDVLTEVREKVKSGAELSDAFEQMGDLFPPIYSSSLRAGERSGELEQVLRRFMRYLRLVLEARKKVISALVYPSVLVGLSGAMLLVMAIYVVPNFAKFYGDLDAELPAITQVTLSISYFLRDHIVAIAVTLLVLALGLRTWIRSGAGRRLFDRFKLGVPLLGTIFHRFALSEFCRSLSTLLAGGIPLPSALETSTAAVGNRFVSEQLEPAIRDVREGSSFHRALERTEAFPNMAIDMIKVGESTGSLDEMLTSVADYFDEFVETRVERLLALVEPAMLVIMGILIALLLVSIYLPMFGALSQVAV